MALRTHHRHTHTHTITRRGQLSMCACVHICVCRIYSFFFLLFTKQVARSAVNFDGRPSRRGRRLLQNERRKPKKGEIEKCESKKGGKILARTTRKLGQRHWSFWRPGAGVREKKCKKCKQ